jgi:hypothetical protein
VLKAAVEGRLTEKRRAAHPDADSVVGFVPSESISVRYIQMQLQAYESALRRWRPRLLRRTLISKCCIEFLLLCRQSWSRNESSMRSKRFVLWRSSRKLDAELV